MAKSTNKGDTAAVGLVFSRDQYERLTAQARALGQSRAEYIRQTVLNRIDGLPLPVLPKAVKA
jgi:predicted DNA-binding protein